MNGKQVERRNKICALQHTINTINNACKVPISNCFLFIQMAILPSMEIYGSNQLYYELY